MKKLDDVGVFLHHLLTAVMCIFGAIVTVGIFPIELARTLTEKGKSHD